MNREEKAHEWQAYLMCLPLEIKVNGWGYISYGEELLYDFCPNLFYGRAFYGPFRVGGVSPFYSIHVQGAELVFDDDDYAPLPLYETADEKAERTQRFWTRVDEQTRRIRDMAWKRRDLRALVGATLWLSPRCRQLILNCLPRETDWYDKRSIALCLAEAVRRLRQVSTACRLLLLKEQRNV